MAVPNELSNVTTSSMKTAVTNYSVSSKQIDAAAAEESVWENPNFRKWLGYYKSIPELKQAVDALAMWSVGKGFETDEDTRTVLEHITGWGEDTFQSIMENMIVVKKINGDAYAEIIKDEDSGTLLNLKPLNPGTMRHVVNSKGIIIRYEEFDSTGAEKKAIHKFSPEKIFHISNDRIANEIHGVSVVESCQWVIDARNEAMSDWRRILHRSTIRVIEVATDDSAKLTTLKTQYAEAIKSGEVLLVPMDKVNFPNAPLNFIDPQGWIAYLENFFYQAVGVPKIILGGSQQFTEASSKIGYLTFEQVYMREQRLLEADLWNQLQIKIEFNRPVSLKEELQENEAANTGQVGFQMNETAMPGMARE